MRVFVGMYMYRFLEKFIHAFKPRFAAETLPNAQQRRTPLIMAAGEGRIDCVRLFMACGADKDAKDKVCHHNYQLFVRHI